MTDEDSPKYPEAGPAHDAAVEAAIEAESAKRQLEHFQAVLDTIADTREDIPSHLIQDVRGIQMDVRTLAEEFGEVADERRQQAEVYRDRMGE